MGVEFSCKNPMMAINADQVMSYDPARFCQILLNAKSPAAAQQNWLTSSILDANNMQAATRACRKLLVKYSGTPQYQEQFFHSVIL